MPPATVQKMIEERSRFLEGFFPQHGYKVQARWKGPGHDRSFDGWSVYRHFTGRLAGVLNFFVVEPTAVIHNEHLELATVFFPDGKSVKAFTALQLAVKDSFLTEMHVWTGMGSRML